MTRMILAAIAGGIALATIGQAAAQPADYYAGKTLRVIVGLAAGG
jgi:hypothetical protein